MRFMQIKLIILLSIVSCNDPENVNVFKEEIGLHSSIGERYYNYDLGLVLDYPNPVYLGPIPDSLSEETTWFEFTDKVKHIDLTHFIWPYGNSKISTLEYYESHDLIDIKEVVFGGYSDAYDLDTLVSGSYPSINENLYFKCRYINSLSRDTMYVWELFFHPPKSEGTLRFTHASKNTRSGLEYIELNGLSNVQNILNHDRSPFQKNPVNHLLALLFEDNFNPHRCINIIKTELPVIVDVSDELSDLVGFIYSLSGDYKKAAEFLKEPSGQDTLYNLLSQDEVSYSSAKDIVIDSSESKLILSLNDHHTYPRPRIFIKDILQELSRNNYKLLLVEDLRMGDFLVDDSVHCNALGFYSRETNYTNLLREALLLGYEIYGYSPDMTLYSKINNNKDLNQLRDSLMYRNILEIFSSNSLNTDNRAIVFSGHGHLSKIPLQGRRVLGNYLVDTFRQDLITVDLTTTIDLKFPDLFDGIELNSFNCTLSGSNIIEPDGIADIQIYFNDYPMYPEYITTSKSAHLDSTNLLYNSNRYYERYLRIFSKTDLSLNCDIPIASVIYDQELLISDTSQLIGSDIFVFDHLGEVIDSISL